MQNMLYVSDLPEEEGRANARRYLEMVGLSDAEEIFPGQISGGMQQRVGIARAFSVGPDLLLMDEPFSHLDAITARSLREELQEMWNKTKKTVLFVTHDVIEAVQLSNRIITLAHGGIVFDDMTLDLPFPRKASDPESPLSKPRSSAASRSWKPREPRLSARTFEAGSCFQQPGESPGV